MKDLPGDEVASGFYQTVGFFFFLFLLDFSSLYVLSLFFFCITARCELV